MTENEDREALAAEYVLGTLDAGERAQAQAMIESDAPFAALVHAWEKKLGELHHVVDPVEPPSHVWDRIVARLGGAAPRGADVVDLTKRLNRWRGAAIVAGALAASLALFVSLKEFAPGYLPQALRPAEQGGRFVAVLQQDARSPGFLLTVDLRTKSFTVRKVGADVPAGHSYELWLVHDRFPQPRSLGVIGDGDFTRRAALAPYDPDIINTATYAVSLEPRGGSPTGVATGPIVFVGKLVEATPD